MWGQLGRGSDSFCKIWKQDQLILGSVGFYSFQIGSVSKVAAGARNGKRSAEARRVSQLR